MTLSRRGLIASGLPLAALACSGQVAAASVQTAEQWGPYEITLNGPQSGNPFTDIRLYATFRKYAQTIKVPGFYDGEGIYRIRFSPPSAGEWRWTTASNAKSLSGHAGRVQVSAP
eukprot:gene23008-29332_t